MNIFGKDPNERVLQSKSTRYIKRVQPSNIFEALLSHEGKIINKVWVKTTVKETKTVIAADQIQFSSNATEHLRGKNIRAAQESGKPLKPVCYKDKRA